MSSPLLSSNLLADIQAKAPAERITFASLFASLEQESLALAIVLLGVAGMAPGISVLAGLLLCLCALELMLGAESIFLPRFISERSLSVQHLTRILGNAERVMRHVERRRRAGRPLPDSVKRAAGLPVLALSLTLFVPIPFSNVMPAALVAAFGLALLADDALLLAGAAAASAVSLALTTAAIGAVIGVGHALL
jgi:hypothetical protein